MERVGALIHKLKEQYDQNVDKKTLLVTVQLLLAEIEQSAPASASKEKVSVILPRVQRMVQDVQAPAENIEIPAPRPAAPAPLPPQDTPTAPIKQADLPDTIKSYVLKPPQQSTMPTRHPKKEEPAPSLFDPVNEVPTLIHQKEVYELNDVHIDGDSLNDKLKEEKQELGTSIKSDPVNDLRRAIGINDRYRFINELFRGDEAMYERSIKTINGFPNFSEAETWIQRELKVKIGWSDNNATVKDFDQVVKRRFS